MLFTPVENDEELEYGFGDISAVFPGMGGNRCSLSDGWFYWSAEEFKKLLRRVRDNFLKDLDFSKSYFIL